MVCRSKSLYIIGLISRGVLCAHLWGSYHVTFAAACVGDAHDVGVSGYHFLEDGLVGSWDIRPFDVFAVCAGVPVGTGEIHLAEELAI